MKRILLCVLAGVCATVGLAADGPKAFRIPIRHADPWAVKTILEGGTLRSPELSAGLGFGQTVNAAVNGANSLLKNGFLVVNAADNSLWWFPKPKTN